MKILGVRNSTKTIRFCVLEGERSNYQFTNCNDENKIDLPKSLKEEADILKWVEDEFKRLFDKYGPFDHLAIKQNENVATRYSTLRKVMFFDCIATMVAVRLHVPYSSQVYANLGTKSKEVCAFIEVRTPKTSTYWDSQMADAVAAAIKNLT